MALEKAAAGKLITPGFHRGLFIDSGCQISLVVFSRNFHGTFTPLSSITVKTNGLSVDGSLKKFTLPGLIGMFVSGFEPEAFDLAQLVVLQLSR